MREPLLALTRGAVRPRLAIDPTRATCCWMRSSPTAAAASSPSRDVVVGEVLDEPRLRRVRGPDAGVAVGLELEAHGARLRALTIVADAAHSCRAGSARGGRTRARRRTPRRTARRARRSCVRQLVVEPEVDVHVLVGRAVERPHRRRRVAAPGRDLSVEEHGVRLVGSPCTAPLPVLLHRVHDRDERAVLTLVGVGAGLAVLDRATTTRALQPDARPPPPPPPPPPLRLPSRSTTSTITPRSPPPPPIAIPGPNDPGSPTEAPRRSDTCPVRTRAPRRNRTAPSYPPTPRTTRRERGPMPQSPT